MTGRFLLGIAFLALATCTPPQASDGVSGDTEAVAADSDAANGSAAEPAGDAQAQAKPALDASAGPPGADAAITAWARDRLGASLIEPVQVFYGDFTGDGAADALAWINLDTGGSGGDHWIALFRNQGGRMTHVRDDQSVLGDEPRNVRFTTGHIMLTTTMPRPGDPHCCPTGSQEWTISTN